MERQNQQDTGGIHRKCLKGKKGQNESDAPDHTRENRTRMRQFKIESGQSDHHENISNVWITDGL